MFDQKNQITLPKYIVHNTRVEAENPVVFEVTTVHKPIQGDPLRVNGIMDHRAFIQRIRQEFETVKEQTTKFPIQYPVEMSPILSASTISGVEESPVVIQIKNFSTRGIGKDTTNKRVLRVRLNIAEKFQMPQNVEWVPRQNFIIRKEDGSIVPPNTDFIHEIPSLPAGAEAYIRATISFTPHVEPYTFAVVTASLDLGNFHFSFSLSLCLLLLLLPLFSLCLLLLLLPLPSPPSPFYLFTLFASLILLALSPSTLLLPPFSLIRH